MKFVFIIALIIMGLWLLLAIYPSFKEPLDAATGANETANYSLLLATYVGNLWWIMILLGILAAVSAWWTYQK